MTNSNISSLQSARNWMDSLGMRSYGEVDLAIAKEAAVGGSSGRVTQSSAEPIQSAWQGTGFAAYASALLEDRRFSGNDLNQLIERAEVPVEGRRPNSSEMSQWCDALQMAKDKVNSSSLPEGDNQNEKFGDTIFAADGDENFRASIEVRIKPQFGNTLNMSAGQDTKDKTNQVVNIRLWI